MRGTLSVIIMRVIRVVIIMVSSPIGNRRPVIRVAPAVIIIAIPGIPAMMIPPPVIIGTIIKRIIPPTIPIIGICKTTGYINIVIILMIHNLVICRFITILILLFAIFIILGIIIILSCRL